MFRSILHSLLLRFLQGPGADSPYETGHDVVAGTVCVSRLMDVRESWARHAGAHYTLNLRTWSSRGAGKRIAFARSLKGPYGKRVREVPFLRQGK